jgi:hypothetical protein
MGHRQVIRGQKLGVDRVCKDPEPLDSAVRRWLAQCEKEATGRTKKQLVTQNTRSE